MRRFQYNHRFFYLDIHKWTGFTKIYHERIFIWSMSLRRFACQFTSTKSGKNVHKWLVAKIDQHAAFNFGACTSLNPNRAVEFIFRIWESSSVYGIQPPKHKRFNKYGYGLKWVKLAGNCSNNRFADICGLSNVNLNSNSFRFKHYWRSSSNHIFPSFWKQIFMAFCEWNHSFCYDHQKTSQ